MPAVQYMASKLARICRLTAWRETRQPRNPSHNPAPTILRVPTQRLLVMPPAVAMANDHQMATAVHYRKSGNLGCGSREGSA